nr:MAG TPA: hypothetical protein [Caudoviricetes sp.]
MSCHIIHFLLLRNKYGTSYSLKKIQKNKAYQLR